MTQENQQFSEVLKKGIGEAEIHQKQMSEEKKKRHNLEIIFEQKMIAHSLEIEEKDQEKRKDLEEQMVQFEAGIAEEQKLCEQQVRAEVKQTLTDCFRERDSE
jgi:hypothetical protein